MTNENDLLSSAAIFQRAREAASTLAWCCKVLSARNVQPGIDPVLSRAFQECDLVYPNPVFEQLQNALDNGTHREGFPVGTILPDHWTDPETDVMYDMPLRIVDYREVTLSNGKEAFGAILLRVNASPNSVIFDENSTRYKRSRVGWYLASHAAGTYLKGCSPDLLDAMAEVVITEPFDGEIDRICSPVFLPSPEELHIEFPERSDLPADKVAWEYFADTPTSPNMACKKRIFRTPSGCARSVWLRSRRTSSDVCYVPTSGNVFNNSPSATNGILPACVVVGHQAYQLR